jgi:hypothetical protein
MLPEYNRCCTVDKVQGHDVGLIDGRLVPDVWHDGMRLPLKVQKLLA